MYTLLKSLGHSDGLELMAAPQKPFQKFVPTGKTSKDFFVVGTRTDVLENGEKVRHIKGGYDFWAWNVGSVGLLPFEIPPFRFPFAIYDNWLLDMVIRSGERNAIDASELIEIHHPHHPQREGYGSWVEAFIGGVTGPYINRYLGYNEPRMMLQKMESSRQSESSNKTERLKDIRYHWQFGTPLTCPYRAYQAEKTKHSNLFVIEKREHHSTMSFKDLTTESCLLDKKCGKAKYIQDGTTKEENKVLRLPVVDTTTPKTEVEKTATKAWRYTLDKQLTLHSNRDGFVLLTAVNYEYRQHLMNFLCNLNRLGMTDHYIVAALDRRMYRWGVLQGLPIYYFDPQAPSGINSVDERKEDLRFTKEVLRYEMKADHKPEKNSSTVYGSNTFKETTKMKSRAVLEILEKGYSVVWSDVDITWFEHPFDALADYMKGNALAIQSNAPYVSNPNQGSQPHVTVSEVKSDDPAGFRRLNSGLYVAPSNSLVKSAFQQIVEAARNSNLTEQPSFDEILCNKESSNRGYDFCTYRPSLFSEKILLIRLLNRFAFPTGAVLVGENNTNVFDLGCEAFMQETGTKLLSTHNNWIKGEDIKKDRQSKAGLWFTDKEHTCLYPGDYVFY